MSRVSGVTRWQRSAHRVGQTRELRRVAPLDDGVRIVVSRKGDSVFFSLHENGDPIGLWGSTNWHGSHAAYMVALEKGNK